MKRCRFGVALLIALLALGLVAGKWMEEYQLELADLARDAWEAAGEGDMKEAAEEIRELEARWNTHRKLASVLADHEQLDEIGRLIRQLRWLEDRKFYEENCLLLSARLEDLARNQRFNLANLF